MMVTATNTNRLLAWVCFLVLCWGNTQALYENDAYIKNLQSQSDFDEQVLQSDGIWMVQFMSPSDSSSQTLAPQYSVIGSLLRGIVHLAAVDVTSAAGKQMAASYKVDESSSSSLPALFIFGNDKHKPAKYTGPRDAQSMVQALVDSIMKTLQERGGGAGTSQQKQSSSSNKKSSAGGGGPSKVVTLTESNFQQEILDNPQVSMVAFIAPWCGYCQKLHPEWEEAAVMLDGEAVVLGRVDATVEQELASIYGVRSYPTIKIFPGGSNKTHQDARDYVGERVASAIVKNALEEVDRSGVPKEIPELTGGKSMLESTCRGHNRICVLAALPHILDSGAAGRNKYRDILASVAKTFRGSAYQFLWFEGTSQPELEQAVELTFGFPAVVALSLDRQAYAVLHGSFSEKSISSFLHSITTGRQSTTKLAQMPTVTTVEPWDGQDGVPPEEEMDLAEIMGWDEEDEL